MWDDREARKRAARLSAKSRAYLLGDVEGKVPATLVEHGYVYADGRLTPFGVRVARIIASESCWMREDSVALDAQVRAERRRKPAKVSRYADPELADACRKILAYRLKYETRRARGSADSGFRKNEPSRTFW